MKCSNDTFLFFFFFSFYVIYLVELQMEDLQNNIIDSMTETLPKYEDINIEDKVLPEAENKDKIEDEVFYNENMEGLTNVEEVTLFSTIQNMQFSDVCTTGNECMNGDDTNYDFISQVSKFFLYSLLLFLIYLNINIVSNINFYTLFILFLYYRIKSLFLKAVL